MTLLAVVLACSGCHAPGPPPPPAPVTFGAAGKICGAAVAGVTIQLTGPSTATTRTDTDGNFAFVGLDEGAYKLTPSLPGYVFTPESTAVAVNGGTVNTFFVDSAAAEAGACPSGVTDPLWISGTVCGAKTEGVFVYPASALTFGESGPRPAVTDASGRYSAHLLQADSKSTITVTPLLSSSFIQRLPGLVFLPANRPVKMNGACVSGQDFVASLSHFISGTATLGGPPVGSGLGPDATLRVTNAADGTEVITQQFDLPIPNYRIEVKDGTYTITSTPGVATSAYTVAPASRTVIVNGADVGGLDFVASPRPHLVYGTMSLGDPKRDFFTAVVLTGGGTTRTARPDRRSGNFVFAGVEDGTYQISIDPRSFTSIPQSRTVSVNGADVGGQDFSVSLNPYFIEGSISGCTAALVSLTGALTDSVRSSDFGGVQRYMFHEVRNGDYVLTPSLPGSAFDPPSRIVTVNGANVSFQDFTCTQ